MAETSIIGFIWIAIWIILMMIPRDKRLRNNSEERPLKEILQPSRTIIFERPTVIQRLDLQLHQSGKGKPPYAIGQMLGHGLTLEASYDHYDPIIRITVQAVNSLNVETHQTPTHTIADMATLLSINDPALNGVIKVDKENQAITYEQRNSLLDISLLISASQLIIDLLMAYPDMIRLGGEVVPTLLAATKKQKFLRPFVIQVLRDIGADTRYRLQARTTRLVCPTCLTRFNHQKVDLPGQFIGVETYYGCRTCWQGREYLVGTLVAVLDEAMTEPIETGIGVVRVNWLANQRPFDFDRVEIKQASDEAVERFVMQVGNDTDEVRRRRYSDMYCEISPTCKLSENTMRILKRAFGKVSLAETTNSG